MDLTRIDNLIERAEGASLPEIIFVRRVEPSGHRLGVFASSFNPVTHAHLELMRLAADQYSLDEMLALAGTKNADKTHYECPLDRRLQMLLLSTSEERRLSVALSTSAFFVDMVDAVVSSYASGAEIFFIIGFDTFERLLDPDDRYTRRYHRKFRDREEALAYLLEHSHLIVAGRMGHGGGADWEGIIGGEPEASPIIPDGRVLFLDFPLELSERSSSEVRERLRAGLSITDLCLQQRSATFRNMNSIHVISELVRGQLSMVSCTTDN